MAGKIVLITGAARNVGRATALAFANEGATVALNAVTSRVELEQVAEEVRARGGRALVAPANIADESQVQEMVARVTRDLGPIDVLVNNAAIRPWKPFLEMTTTDWDEVLKVNLYGPFFLCKAVLLSMVERHSGVIVNVTGPNAHIVRPAHKVHVDVSKTALWGLTRALAGEFGPQGVRINAVAPSELQTERTHPEWYPPHEWGGFVKGDAKELSRVPLRRQGKPEEIAAAILFLASDAAAFITGQSLQVSGGVVMT